LAQNFPAGQAGFRRKRLRGRAWAFAQRMHRSEKPDGRIDVAVADTDNVATIDPAEQRITALIIYTNNARDDIDVTALEKAERTDFGRKSVARIVMPRWVLLQRENAGAAPHAPDAAVAPSADDAVKLHGAADKDARDPGCLRQAFVNGAQKSAPQCHATLRKQ
jgi:hypothetical protein